MNFLKKRRVQSRLSSQKRGGGRSGKNFIKKRYTHFCQKRETPHSSGSSMKDSWDITTSTSLALFPKRRKQFNEWWKKGVSLKTKRREVKQIENAL